MRGAKTDYVLTLACPDAVGIVHAVTGLLAESRANIQDSAQFADPDTGRFFMRVAVSGARDHREALEGRLAELASRMKMEWQLHDAHRKQRVLILVSRIGHCLNDLLYRYRSGTLDIDIPAVVSNHREFYQLSAWHNVPFHQVTPGDDARLLQIIAEERIDLVVLARYMQVLSADVCARLPGRIINIHHSFLPSFKGAKPYHQAHQRGVKLIGATAHYVTADLDEGPIIEQEVERVDHGMTADDLVAVGRDVESVVLARAVRLHIEHRVFLDGHKTVVFR
jgi:formyltetrahydrofolate deformylase